MDLTALLLIAILLTLLTAAGLLVALLQRRPESALAAFKDALERALREEQQAGRAELRQQLDSFSGHQEQRISGFGDRLELLRTQLAEEQRQGRTEAAEQQRLLAESLGQRLAELTQRNEQRIADMRATLDQQLQRMQADNAQKLEQMRATVDEKLQSTLETRLGESFRLVSERLEHVQRGLGEMQQLATGVGDLKRVLSNVKTRGTFGEVQLGGLLEHILLPDQYEANCAPIPGRGERVEFAIRLPGGEKDDAPMWLPIDAKFPRDDYERLVDAQERGDAEQARAAGDALERAIRKQAKDICLKYISPPHTSDYALMFLPTEGLFAEVLRRPGLLDRIQREHRVVITGPTTLAAVLSSLRMGFQTLAIQRRSGEVRELLSAVKTEFGKFGDVLLAVRKSLDAASKKLGKAESKTRTIERKLRDVQALPSADSQEVLGVEFEEEEEP